MVRKRYIWLCNVLAISSLAPLFAALCLLFIRPLSILPPALMLGSFTLLILSIIIGNRLLKCPHCGEKGIGAYYKIFKKSHGERLPYCHCCGKQVGFK